MQCSIAGVVCHAAQVHTTRLSIRLPPLYATPQRTHLLVKPGQPGGKRGARAVRVPHRLQRREARGAVEALHCVAAPRGLEHATELPHVLGCRTKEGGLGAGSNRCCGGAWCTQSSRAAALAGLLRLRPTLHVAHMMARQRHRQRCHACAQQAALPRLCPAAQHSPPTFLLCERGNEGGLHHASKTLLQAGQAVAPAGSERRAEWTAG